MEKNLPNQTRNRYKIEDTLDHVYYILPNCLFEDPKYKALSVDDKVTFALLRDRHVLSTSNDMIDISSKRPYVIFTQEEIEELIGRCRKTVYNTLLRLENHELIIKKVTPYGFPNKILVRNVPNGKFSCMPKFLFTEEFISLSNCAKALYSRLRNLHSLSVKNNWINQNGEVYIECSKREMQKLLGVCSEQIWKSVKELIEFNLLDDVFMGKGRKNRIYLKMVEFGVNEKYKVGHFETPLEYQAENIDNIFSLIENQSVSDFAHETNQSVLDFTHGSNSDNKRGIEVSVSDFTHEMNQGVSDFTQSVNLDNKRDIEASVSDFTCETNWSVSDFTHEINRGVLPFPKSVSDFTHGVSDFTHEVYRILPSNNTDQNKTNNNHINISQSVSHKEIKEKIHYAEFKQISVSFTNNLLASLLDIFDLESETLNINNISYSTSAITGILGNINYTHIKLLYTKYNSLEESGKTNFDFIAELLYILFNKSSNNANEDVKAPVQNQNKINNALPEVDVNYMVSYIKKLISYEDLLIKHQYNKDFIDEMVLIILDVITSKDCYIKIAGENKSIEVIKSVFHKLNIGIVEDVMDKFNNITDKITNKRAYIRTMLYIETMESSAHYKNLVNYDMYNYESY